MLGVSSTGLRDPHCGTRKSFWGSSGPTPAELCQPVGLGGCGRVSECTRMAQSRDSTTLCSALESLGREGTSHMKKLSEACFGAVCSDSKGWGGQHLSGSLARRCFEGDVPWCVPFSVSQSLLPLRLWLLRALVSFPAAVGKAPAWLGGELWGVGWLHADPV